MNSHRAALAIVVALGVVAPPASTPAPAEFRPRDVPGTTIVADIPELYRLRTTSRVKIDGALDEPAWKKASATRRFCKWNGKGMPAWATSVRACWDELNLYLAYECEDRDIHTPYRKRDDALYNGEVVEAFLAPEADVRRYLEIEVSPANVLFDALVFNERPAGKMGVDLAWNAPGLRSAVRVQGTLNQRADRDRRWSVEIALPFSDLALPRPVRAGDTWRANFYRIDRGRVDEYSAWSPTLTAEPNFHVPRRFGKLVFAE